MFECASNTPVLPSRPVIPPLAIALVVCICAQQWILTGSYGNSSIVVLAALSLVIISCALLPVVPLPPLPAAPIGMALLVGLISAGAFELACDQKASQLLDTPVSSLTFEISSDPSSFGDRWRSRAHAVKDGQTQADVWLVSSDQCSLGDRVQCVGQISPLKDDLWGRRDKAQGICGTVSVKHITRIDPPDGMLGELYLLRQNALTAIQPEKSDGRALLAGCACGYRIDLVANGIEDVLSKSGLVHLVAVSGGHLTTVAALLAMILEKTRFSGKIRLAVVLLATAIFTAFCGAPTSAVRAWVMTGSAMVAPLMGRRSHGLSAASFSGLTLCLIDPATSSDMGFQLSALSVAGLYIFSPYAEYVLAKLMPFQLNVSFLPQFIRFRFIRLTQGLLKQIAASVVAQLITMPITVLAFGTISAIGPFANALLGPAFSWFVSLGCISVALLWVPFIGELLVSICEFCASSILLFSFMLSSIPGACIAVGNYALPIIVCTLVMGLLLLVFWPAVSPFAVRSTCALLMLAMIGSRLVTGIVVGGRLVVLDVGQGDAILIQDGNHSVLVDTGPDDAVVQALARNHISSLDAVVITHLHDDHYGGLDELVGFVQVRRVYVGQGVSDNMPDEMRDALHQLGLSEVAELSDGDKLSIGQFELEVISPDGATDGLENEDSLVMKVRFVDSTSMLSALLCGDAEADVIDPLIQSGRIDTIDVLKLGHHGSEASVTEPMLARLQPELCVASAGEGNRYGHPAQATMEMVEASGAYGMCTMDTGDICIEPVGDGISVSCAVPYDGAAA